MLSYTFTPASPKLGAGEKLIKIFGATQGKVSTSKRTWELVWLD